MKKTVVFLPGMLCDERIWSYQMERLQEICTPLFVDLTKQSSLDGMLSAIDKVEQDSFDLIGFSMGGYVAMEYLLKNKHRVNKIALIGASQKGYTEEEKQQQIIAIDNVIAGHGAYKGLSGALLRQFVHNDNLMNKPILELIHDMSEQAGTNVFVNQRLATLDRKDRTEELKEILPESTLLVIGEDDKRVRRVDMEELANTINSKLIIIDKSGHMVPLEQPAVLTDILRKWITR
jgi:pimeloyl-ACP methyl ester carboxylesterase